MIRIRTVGMLVMSPGNDKRLVRTMGLSQLQL